MYLFGFDLRQTFQFSNEKKLTTMKLVRRINKPSYNLRSTLIGDEVGRVVSFRAFSSQWTLVQIPLQTRALHEWIGFSVPP